jgi:hypothetical protein
MTNANTFNKIILGYKYCFVITFGDVGRVFDGGHEISGAGRLDGVPVVCASCCQTRG